jgi:disulfide bond formation protein DsbB
MRLPSIRLTNFVGFVICAGLLGYAYYSQFSENLEPCPLCIFQRIGVIAVAVFFLLAAIHNPGRIGARVYAVLIALGALGGGSVAARHVYLQHLPAEQVPECGPGLSYMFDVFPIGEALQQVFTGSGECADVSWLFLGLSMPSWVLIWFVALGGVGLVRNWSR